LNPKQYNACREILTSILGIVKMAFFLNGDASSRRTYIYNTMATRTCLEGQIVISVASMDIASFFFFMEVI
jgi:hypothetical protein